MYSPFNPGVICKRIYLLEDCEILQADLQTIYDWARHVNMHFNSDKFECMRLWPRQSTKPDFKYLGPDDNIIEIKESLSILALTCLLNSKLKRLWEVPQSWQAGDSVHLGGEAFKL